MADKTNSENTCVVCFKNVELYSIGECDHPVCYECSTRMRVLCLQNECPICRHSLSRVVFTYTVEPYKDLKNRVISDKLFERQFKIAFSDDKIKEAYEKLLEHQCKLCEKLPPFRSFNTLSDHMRRVHERHYCDLCVENLKIFSNERKSYTRQELAHHRRKGDKDDTSHRGHPLCEFCDKRFMDNDDLYRHLRKEHLYCHLCDADGRNQYYPSHTALAQHFRTEHFLCEEGECAGSYLSSVFRTEIDLKAHKASVHGRGLARAAARQARTLDLQFNITPHPGVRVQPHRGDRDREREREEQERQELTPPVQVTPRIDTGSVDEFPSLSAAPQAPVLVPTAVRQSYSAGSSSGLTRDDRNFPSLDGGKSRPAPPQSKMSTPTVAATLLRNNAKPAVSIQLQSKPASASNFRLTQPTGSHVSAPQKKNVQFMDDDFPSLGGGNDDHPSLGASTPQPAKVTLIDSQQMQALKADSAVQPNRKPRVHSSDAFPALSSNSTPSAPPQWITVAKPKEKAKAKPIEKPPQPTSFNPIADFPQLSVKTKTTKKPAQTPVICIPVETRAKKERHIPTVSAHEPVNKGVKKKQLPPTDYTEDESVNLTLMYNPYKPKKISGSASALAEIKPLETKVESKIGTIGSLPTNGEIEPAKKLNGNNNFVVAPGDYPPLSGKSKISGFQKIDTSANTPKTEATSKSFLSNGKTVPNTKGRPKCDGMTFTNSSGQTFPAPVHAFIPPPNFEQRNRRLVSKFTDALGGPEALENFKAASRSFRESTISADEFYVHCESVLGSKHLKQIFPELVALLPDINKQQELVVGRESEQLRTCSTCGQLVLLDDFTAHDSAHWPPLAASR